MPTSGTSAVRERTSTPLRPKFSTSLLANPTTPSTVPPISAACCVYPMNSIATSSSARPASSMAASSQNQFSP